LHKNHIALITIKITQGVPMVRTGKRYRSGRADSNYDAIIIGSGIGGLTTAALLSKLGKKVCVLEQHYTAGGYTHSYVRNGYEWDVGVHYVGEVHKPWSVLRLVFDTITDSKLEWAEMDALYDKIIFKDQSYNFKAGKNAFREELIEHFPHEAEGIDKYIEMIYDVSRQIPKFFAGQAMPKLAGQIYNKSRSLLMPDFFFKSVKEVLNELFTDQKLIGVICGQWGDYGLPPSEASFMMHAMIAKHYMAGGCYPVGGSWEIANKIIPVIQQSGGEVFTYAGVEKIIIKKNKAIGVQLVNGDQIFAKQIASNVGIFPTIKQLLPEDAAAKYDLKKLESKITTSSSHLCIYAGFKGNTKELGLNTTNLWIYPGYDHDKNVKVYREKPEGNLPLIYISFPSAKDPTWEDRYPDKSTVEIVTIGQWDKFAPWQDKQWNKRGDDYEEMKQAIAEEMLDVLFKQHPQLREALDYYELSTPVSTKWFQWNMKGEIYGIDHTVTRFKQDWLHPETPIKNLYLTGSDIVTAGVGGALMGGVMSTSCMLGLQGYKVMKLIKQTAKSKSVA
jgi:all-trans-retinol 13,14-reductase